MQLTMAAYVNITVLTVHNRNVFLCSAAFVFGTEQPPHHAVTERDLSFGVRTLVDTRQKTARQSESLLQSCIVAV